MAESGFVVRVPAAEELVGALRAEHDASAGLGVPAHITILFPFMDPAHITEAILRTCAQVVGAQPAFRFSLAAVGRFDETAYLQPAPAAPFVALTEALAARFPAFPPYGGQFTSVIPHLTVAHGSAAGAAHVQAALITGLAARGPVSSECTSVALLENSSGRWRLMHDFLLAPAGGT